MEQIACVASGSMHSLLGPKFERLETCPRRKCAIGSGMDVLLDNGGCATAVPLPSFEAAQRLLHEVKPNL